MEISLKPSRYNKFFEDNNNSIIAYNTLSGALAKLTPEQYNKIQYILAQCTNMKNDIIERDSYLDFLVNGRFLIDDDVDELNILKTRNALGKFTQDKLGVTIMPTLKCNFRCIYCFEEHKNQTMSQNVMDTLVDWVRLEMSHRQLLEVGWFGGEPLLCMDIIRELTGKLRQICLERQCEYRAEMTSNGYLLSREIIRDLKELGITQIQVTLDGPANIHDKRRYLADGSPTFDIILSNLIDLVDEGGIELSLRPTIDNGNVEGIYELMDILVERGIHNKLFFNPQNVQPSPVNNLSCLGGCAPKTAEFAEVRANILIYASRRGFIIDPPSIICQACPTQNINSYLVSPLGELFKCGSFLRPEDRIGYLDPTHPQKAHINFAKHWEWVGTDPFENIKCRECEVLPLCMGGCSAMKNMKVDEEDGCCIYYRYNLEKELIGRYGNAIQNTTQRKHLTVSK